MDIKTLNELANLIETYQNLIKVQNDVIREKEETIVLLKKYITIQEQEKEVDALIRHAELLKPCLN